MEEKEKLTSIVSILQNRLVENEEIRLEHFKKSISDRGRPDFDIGISSGILGVILFFLEIYEEKKEPTYLTIAINSINEVIKFLEENDEYTYHFGLMNGMGGTLYVLYRIYQIKRDAFFLRKMILFSQRCHYFIKSTEIDNSYWEGKSGLLYVLTHIYHVSGNIEIQRAITAILNTILQDIKLNKNGLFWNTRLSDPHRNYGIAYGTSGIRCVLSSLNQFLDERLLEFIHVHSTCNEDLILESYTNPNSPFGNTILSDLGSQNHPNRSNVSLSKFSEIVGWKNGLIGLGIVRVLHAKASGASLVEEKILPVLFQQMQDRLTGIDDISLLDACGLKILGHLCKGDLSPDHFLYQELSQKVELLISQKENGIYNENNLLGFDNGLIGLGYYYLLTPERAQTSLFAPNKELAINKGLIDDSFLASELSLEKLFTLLSRNYFPYLTHLFLNKKLEIGVPIQNKRKEPLYKQFLEHIESLMHIDADGKNIEMMEDLYVLERSKFQLAIKNETFEDSYERIYLFHQESRKLSCLSESDILSFCYKIVEGTQFVETKFNWKNLNLRDFRFDPPAEDTSYYTHIRKSYRDIGVEMYSFNSFEEILTLFETPLSGIEVLDVLVEYTKNGSKEVVNQLKNKLVDLIIFGVQNGIIEKCKN